MMGSIAANREYWSAYDWSSAGGDEWSHPWGSVAHQWAISFYSRIAAFVPQHTILEIAPGFGRWTNFLLGYCQRFYGVDLAPPAVKACQKRFEQFKNAKFIENDGKSLIGVPDHSVDFAFSADSLVHADRDAMAGYLSELRRALRPGAVAFLHHSNLGALPPNVSNQHGRDPTVSAAWLRAECKKAGLVCVSQELLNWGQSELNDCFSLVGFETSEDSETQVFHNENFETEIARSRRLSEFYQVHNRN
jgi:SAM-dependent methyltransferase